METTIGVSEVIKDPSDETVRFNPKNRNNKDKICPIVDAVNTNFILRLFRLYFLSINIAKGIANIADIPKRNERKDIGGIVPPVAFMTGIPAPQIRAVNSKYK